MQYHETHDGQIRADLARRIGVIMAREYKGKHEVTLCISLLHTLLTQCQELITSLDIGDLPYDMLFAPLTKEPVYGISTEFIVQDDFPSGNKYKEKSKWCKRDNLYKVQQSIRHALCHPTSLRLDTITDTNQYLSTGYTAIYNNEIIDKIVFIHSPNVDEKGKLKISEKDAKVLPYKIFRIDIPVNCLQTLLFNLSQLLAQALVPGWDGKYITPLNKLPQASGF